MLDLSKATKQELMAMVEQQARNNANGLIVKLTDKGGIYIRHDTFKEFSTAKGKDYVAGINLGYNTAHALFGNPVLLKAVIDSLASLAIQSK